MSPLKYIFTYNTDKQVWSPKPTAPAIASGSADAGVAGYLLERQTRRGDFFFFLSVFTPSSAIFCGGKFGNGEKYSCKKKKKVFMNNGTLQIHLVPRHFFFLASHYSQLYNMLERDLVLSRGTVCSQISTLIVAADVGRLVAIW